ncbi:paraquat-inducible protein A [Trinickia caryophylli]|uniref:Paraquat-inducible protein A n=1 Tax=Trinickia caryophylli TaxID=28094 RepID=A0A1X7CD04_TRICW|nr:paraquat-inducible protein A [Trinickia caryophylli]PMS12486.1 paraquat-inducible membrane protein A [Trinickia caryophylli]TRX19688.1 paraquat-inducible membrane protein A [Trinickia caryophylli]WQE12998.1 paraquat-inducible protein A [Trinickia caryophylli]SME93833.1 paraquat-inducible protein A [Trinickia caryophylli]GLU30730.1 paraquat-inducible protein [Trinickia caryophylli]
MKYTTAARTGLVGCHACGNVEPRVRPAHGHQHCSRCGAALHLRNPDSIMRTWALLIAAALLYIPANLLPVLHTSSLFGDEDDTIMSGVVYFWVSGDWPLAVIVFVASILVPMMKLSVLALLAATAQQRSPWRPLERTRLYRIVERIGRWSMLDVFVVTLTVALVRFKSLAVITAGWGALAFAAVVVLTMLASLQFDPRLIWDAIDDDGEGNGQNEAYGRGRPTPPRRSNDSGTTP